MTPVAVAAAEEHSGVAGGDESHRSNQAGDSLLVEQKLEAVASRKCVSRRSALCTSESRTRNEP